MKEKIPVSVIVMTKNEEIDLPKCLASLTPFQEVFVVDSGSTDRTIEIAKEAGATIVSFSWNGKYPKKKQWCLDNLPFKHEWVLYVDADEEVQVPLAEEIREILSKPIPISGYFAGFDYVFLNKILRHGHRVFKLVLFKRTCGYFKTKDDLEAQNAGEVELHFQPTITGTVSVLRNKLVHKDCDSLFHYFERHNRYSDWEAILREKSGLVDESDTQPGIRKYLKRIFDLLPFKGAIAFLDSFFLRLGFLDGKAGFHYAISRAFYYWMIEIKILEKRLSHINGSQNNE